MTYKLVKIIFFLLLLSSRLYAYEVEDIFIDAIPKQWIKVPDSILNKGLREAEKVLNQKQIKNNVIRYNLIKSSNWLNAPNVTIIFSYVDSPTNNILLKTYEDYGNSIINDYISNAKIIDPGLKLKDYSITYYPDKNIIKTDYIIQYSNGVEHIQLNSIFFTRYLIIGIHGGFFTNDNLIKKYISEYNNYINKIEIPPNDKIYKSWLDKNWDSLERNLPILGYLLTLIIIIFFLYLLQIRYPKIKKPLDFLINIILFLFKVSLSIFIRKSIQGQPVSSTDSKDNQTNINSTSIDPNSINFNNITIDDNLSDSISIDKNPINGEFDNILSTSNELDNILSNESQVDDLLSDDKTIKDLLNDTKSK